MKIRLDGVKGVTAFTFTDKQGRSEEHRIDLRDFKGKGRLYPFVQMYKNGEVNVDLK